MKQIFTMPNGEVEFKDEKDFERYLKGEKPELLLDEKTGRYKAIFN